MVQRHQDLLAKYRNHLTVMRDSVRINQNTINKILQYTDEEFLIDTSHSNGSAGGTSNGGCRPSEECGQINHEMERVSDLALLFRL